jgi:hypothetical protein
MFSRFIVGHYPPQNAISITSTAYLSRPEVSACCGKSAESRNILIRRDVHFYVTAQQATPQRSNRGTVVSVPRLHHENQRDKQVSPSPENTRQS